MVPESANGALGRGAVAENVDRDADRIEAASTPLTDSKQEIGFDYSIVADNEARELLTLARKVRVGIADAANEIMRVGLRLIRAKEILGHGNFLTWIAAELKMSAQSALNFMNLARRFDCEIPNGLEFQPLTVLYELAAPSTPQIVVQKAIEAGEAGTRLSRDYVRVLKEVAASPEGQRAIKQVAKEVRAELLATHHVERQHKLERIAARKPEYPCGRLFSLVLVDVPRHHNVYANETGSEKAPEEHYPTMSFRELCDFPINKFAAPDSIILFWSTAASLIDDLDILAEWGFVSLRRRDEAGKLLRDTGGEPNAPLGGGRYGSHQIWRKVRSGRQTGTGRWFWDQHEVLIAARRGNVHAPLPGLQAESVFDAAIGAHSEKPHVEVRRWVNRCWPLLTKVEIFARGEAPEGWVFWGNQAGASA